MAHTPTNTHRPISIAPMMDKTNRHFRWFLRLLSKHIVLYTEMITSSAIIHGNREALLGFDSIERPIILQLGGSNVQEIAEAIQIAEEWNYDGYNLNIGCPSDKVQHRQFGACLMAWPELVAEIVEVMHKVGTKPVSVKHRIGITAHNTCLSKFEDMVNFISTVEKYTKHFIVHARIAILEGLSPKENRQIPPLRYEDVYRLKRERPHLRIEINGGIRSYQEIDLHLAHCDAVMLGRLAYERPWLIAELDERYFQEYQSAYTSGSSKSMPITRRSIINSWFQYTSAQVERGVNPRSLVWPVLELFAGEQGSRKWKQSLSSNAIKSMALKDFFAKCLESAPIQLLDTPAGKI